jgi:hexulose-6-phosphate isomerase
MIGVPSEAQLREWKEAGFEGMESTDRGASPAKAEAARKVAEKLGMRIHSVMYGWANFNKPASVEGDLATVETSLKAAAAYGANTVLLVPCRIDGKMPRPWEFDVRFDPASGHLKQVVAGDNAPYADYIANHNRSADASREAVKRLIPVAEKTGIIIALENVWNNMWVTPELAQNFVSSFDNPWIRAYFDIGNHVCYSPPQKWIRTLGKLIVKCHVKDFKLNANGHGGEFCNIRDGSVNWPAVRAALAELNYDSWMSIEGGDLSAKEHSRRFDLILDGK